jgi:hypothetical protein
MEFSIANIVKIILGVLVIVAVAYGLYLFFSNNVSGAFGGFGLDESSEAFLALL